MDDLRLNQNKLFGLIPECLGNITSLRYLYLNSNKLTFVIPTRLGNLKDILEINLSSNSLWQSATTTWEFQSYNTNRFFNEPIHRKNPNYNYSESNLLGMGSFGSVYKAILKDTTVLAINVFNLQVEGAFKSFDIECEIIRHIQHRNLTKVTSSCSNLDFKVVVLEYMPNGSLEKWLYSYNYFLDMLQRLAIMIDVACALKHLHYGYSIPLVHCDFKPNNILLDNDM
ncbi:hypothetical protein ACSBR1_014556 [Camellia fascicularis]